MNIAGAKLEMTSRHLATEEHQVRESLRMWVGNRRPDAAPESAGTPTTAAQVRLSEAARQAQAREAQDASPSKAALAEAKADPKLDLIRSVIEMLIGRKIEIFVPEAAPDATSPDLGNPPLGSERQTTGNRPAGYGVEYDYHESYTETEQTDFTAQGVVSTADGREFRFTLQLSMSRSYYAAHDLSIRLGDAALKDPLVLNFNGKAAELGDVRFQFDLDADGRAEALRFVAPGSGFLAFDRNGDGRINDGSELFGALTGDGFGELAALDDDGNGWIDANDAAFQHLRIWRLDAHGQQRLDSLASAQIGALSLAHIDTPFALKDAHNRLQGLIRSTGVFLQETGHAGTIQKLDLVV